MKDRDTVFANFQKHPRSWYVLCRSSELSKKKPKSFEFLNKRVVAYRNADGAPQLFSAQCPHMGVDLGHGKIIDETIQCAMHHWCFDQKGACTHAPELNPIPNRRLLKYPALEHAGLIFVFNGEQSDFELPQSDIKNHFYIRFPRSYRAVHPHLLTANGVDSYHITYLHEFDSIQKHQIHKPTNRSLALEVFLRPKSSWIRLLTNSQKLHIHSILEAIGGNISFAKVSQPNPYQLLIINTPSCNTQGAYSDSILYVPKTYNPLKWISVLFLLYYIFKDDIKIMKNFNAHKGATEHDYAYDSFVEVVNEMECF